MFPGIELSDGVTTIVVAPVSLRMQFDEPYKAHVDRIMQGVGDDRQSFNESAVEVLLACARRNHPTLQRSQLLDLMDFADLGKMLTWAMTKSGMVSKRPLDQTTKPLEIPSLDQASSDSSSTQPAGPSTTSSTT